MHVEKVFFSFQIKLNNQHKISNPHKQTPL